MNQTKYDSNKEKNWTARRLSCVKELIFIIIANLTIINTILVILFEGQQNTSTKSPSVVQAYHLASRKKSNKGSSRCLTILLSTTDTSSETAGVVVADDSSSRKENKLSFEVIFSFVRRTW